MVTKDVESSSGRQHGETSALVHLKHLKLLEPQPLQLPISTANMSRAAQRGGATPSKRLAEDGGELHAHLSSLNLQTPTSTDKSSDICPVCKSSRYLNPNMRFLVNPECYHKMCESCVDRIFSHGPAPCPIAGCRRTLRKAKFRKQTFEDIQVEREVDIRRRMAKTYAACLETALLGPR